MNIIFNPGSRYGAGARLFFCSLILGLGLQASAQDRAIVEVWGRPIYLSQIRSAPGGAKYNRSLTPREKEQLSQRIWCELSRGYLRKHKLEPSADEIKFYAGHIPNSELNNCAALEGESAVQATLSRLKFDRLLYQKWGGRVLEKGSDRVPVDARQVYLEQAQREGVVKIVDSRFSAVLSADKATSARQIPDNEAKAYFDQPWWEAGSVSSPPLNQKNQSYVIKKLSGDDQVRIDCSNGPSFVIRKQADGLWYEELMMPVIGKQSGYKTVPEAALVRCSRISR